MLKKLFINKTLLNGALFSIYSFINKGFTFLLLILLAKYITPEEYGYLSLFSTVIMLMGYFVALHSEGYQGVVFFQEGREGQKKVITGVTFIVFLFIVLVCFLLIIAGTWIGAMVDMSLPMLIYALGISASTVFKNMYLDNLRLNENVKLYGAISCSSAILFFILTLVLVIGFKMSWQGQVMANLIVSVLYGGIGLFLFVKNRYMTTDFKEILIPMLTWGIPLIPHAASSFIRQGCDRYIINNFHSIEEVGLFSFALNIANIIMIIGLGFNSSNSVDIYKTLGDKNMSNVEKCRRLSHSRRIFLVGYMVCTIFVAILSYFIVPLFLPHYTDSRGYILILCFFGLFQCMYLLWTNYLFFFKKTKSIMYVTFGSSLLHLLLSLCLTRYSLYLTAIIYCLTQGLVVLLIAYLAKKELNNNIYYKNVL